MQRRNTWTAYGLGIITAIAAGLLGQGLLPRTAYGQVPDSGRQRMVMIEELKKANKQLAEMTVVLKQIQADLKADRAAKDGSK